MKRDTFVQIGRRSPCDSCAAPCCQTQLFTGRTPKTYMDLDWLGYQLNFPRTEVLYYTNGDFAIVKWEQCGHFKDAKCSLHNMPEQPRTCVYYNPYNCWYYRNFTEGAPLDLIRFNRERFQLWTAQIEIDENGNIALAPTFEATRQMVQHIEVFPKFPLMTDKDKGPVESPISRREHITN